jgi:hypothetical protein
MTRRWSWRHLPSYSVKKRCKRGARSADSVNHQNRAESSDQESAAVSIISSSHWLRPSTHISKRSLRTPVHRCPWSKAGEIVDTDRSLGSRVILAGVRQPLVIWRQPGLYPIRLELEEPTSICGAYEAKHWISFASNYYERRTGFYFLASSVTRLTATHGSF